MKYFLLVGTLLLLLTRSAHAAVLFTDFTGNYAYENWDQLHSDNDSGSIVSHNSSTVVIRGSDTGSGTGSSFDFVITFTESTPVWFNWSYSSIDGAIGTDDAGWLLNGVFHRLTGNTESPTSGFTQVSVNAGDTFGWRVRTMDNEEGYGTLEVTPVPEPSTAITAGLLLVFVSAAAWKNRRNQRKTM